METDPTAPEPTLAVPLGWEPGFLPGSDLLLMPLPDARRTTPVVTVRRGAAHGDPAAGHPVHDPRTDSTPESPRLGTPGGPPPGRGLPVGMDRWSGGDWFGLRFLRLAPAPVPDGRVVAELRWLL